MYKGSFGRDTAVPSGQHQPPSWAGIWSQIGFGGAEACGCAVQQEAPWVCSWRWVGQKCCPPISQDQYGEVDVWTMTAPFEFQSHISEITTHRFTSAPRLFTHQQIGVFCGWKVQPRLRLHDLVLKLWNKTVAVSSKAPNSKLQFVPEKSIDYIIRPLS